MIFFEARLEGVCNSKNHNDFGGNNGYFSEFLEKIDLKIKASQLRFITASRSRPPKLKKGMSK